MTGAETRKDNNRGDPEMSLSDPRSSGRGATEGDGAQTFSRSCEGKETWYLRTSGNWGRTVDTCRMGTEVNVVKIYTEIF